MGKNYGISFKEQLQKVVDHFSEGNLKQFCARFGLPYTTWVSTINEHGNPRSENVRQLVLATGVSADWLLLGKGEMKGGSEEPNNNDSKLLRELFEQEREAKERIIGELAAKSYELKETKLKLKTAEEELMKSKNKR